MVDHVHTIINEVTGLRRDWQPRAAAMKKWYQLIRLNDNLAQANMESVISPDPRSSYNMANWLLTPRPGAFVVDTEGLTEDQIQEVGQIERFADRQLALNIRRTRGSMLRPVVSRLVSFMLATGWISVGSIPQQDGWVIEAFNPAEIFPEYGSGGNLIRLGRAYQVSGPEAMAMILRNGWILPDRKFDRRQWWIHSLWKMTEHGPFHGVTIGSSHLAKPMTLAPLPRIPIHVIPVGGLPDDGTITGTNHWRGEVGQSFLAPLLDIQNNYNKMLTYMQQLLRDTANPRWVERVRESGALDPERLWERGAIFSIQPDEDIFPVPTPPLPPELRGHEFEIRNMIQRASFSDASMGNITTQINGFLLNQVTAQAKQTLSPFFEGIRDVLGEAATLNIRVMRGNNLPLGKDPFPQSLPEELFLDFKYDVKVPGDFLQRISAAKVANPNFTLSKVLLYDEMFPEVTSAQRELARVQTEDAMQNPVFKQLVVIRELSVAAREARSNNDAEFAMLLERAADLVERQFGEVDSEQAPGLPGLRPEALPADVQNVLAGGS